MFAFLFSIIFPFLNQHLDSIEIKNQNAPDSLAKIVLVDTLKLVSFVDTNKKKETTLKKENESIYQQSKQFLQIGIIGSSYNGSLNRSFDNFMPGFSLGIRFNNKKKLNMSFKFFYFLLQSQASDPYYYSIPLDNIPYPNLFFNTQVFSLAFDLNYNFYRTEKLCIYISQGIGIIRYEVNDNQGKTLIDQKNTRKLKEIYSNISFNLPTSLGIIYFINPNIGIGYSAQLLNQFTEYLDNIFELDPKRASDLVWLNQIGIYIGIK